ncbi:MAG: STAS/SEC14 domain-containing protein [Gammaproteobacteria bacterium]|nr:STAS/SEC14 domain-containing protein [Gammaproteobacteria bacterium]
MSFTCELNQDHEYVICVMSDKMTLDDHNQVREQAAVLLKQQGWNRLLVDARQIDAKMSLTEDYQFTESHRSNLPVTIHLAVIHRPEETERFRFIETVAVNRGQNMKIFTDADAAITWLTSH